MRKKLSTHTIISIAVCVIAIAAMAAAALIALHQGKNEAQDMPEENNSKESMQQEENAENGVATLPDEDDDEAENEQDSSENHTLDDTKEGSGTLEELGIKEYLNQEVANGNALVNPSDDEIEYALYVKPDDESYINVDGLKYVYNEDGDYISIGASVKDADRIYLNFKNSVENNVVGRHTHYGYYITPSRGEIMVSDDNYTNSYEDNVLNYALGSSLREMTPATYVDEENYGVSWVNNFLIDGKEKTGAILNARAINIDTHMLIAIFDIVIEYDTDTASYSITDIRDSDLLAKGEMTEEDHDALVDHAVSMLTDPLFGTTRAFNLSDDEIIDPEYIKENAYVCKVDDLYYSDYYTTKGSTATSYSVKYEDIYAVTLKIIKTEDMGSPDETSWAGYITIYYSPEADYPASVYTSTDGYIEYDRIPVTSMDLRYFGYSEYSK